MLKVTAAVLKDECTDIRHKTFEQHTGSYTDSLSLMRLLLLGCFTFIHIPKVSTIDIIIKICVFDVDHYILTFTIATPIHCLLCSMPYLHLYVYIECSNISKQHLFAEHQQSTTYKSLEWETFGQQQLSHALCFTNFSNKHKHKDMQYMCWTECRVTKYVLITLVTQ